MSKLNWVFDGNGKWAAFSTFQDGQELKWVVTSENGNFHIKDSNLIVDHHDHFKSLHDACHFCENFDHNTVHNIFDVNFHYHGPPIDDLDHHNHYDHHNDLGHNHSHHFDDADLDHHDHFGPF